LFCSIRSPIVMDLGVNPEEAAEESTAAAAGRAKELTRTPSSTIKIFTVKSENNRQTSELSAEFQRNGELEQQDIPAVEETREADEDAVEAPSPAPANTAKTRTKRTNVEVQNANAILAEAIKIASKGREKSPLSMIVVEKQEEKRETAEGGSDVERVLRDYVPLPDDAVWATLNEETSKAWAVFHEEGSKAWSTINDESVKAYHEWSTRLNKFNESMSQSHCHAMNDLSQAHGQALNGLTTAYVMAEEDLSRMGLALSQTQTVKSINGLLGIDKATEVNKEEEGDDEEEGEGMEISLFGSVYVSRA
jgi:hypothetical protein